MDRQRDGAGWGTIKALSTGGPRLSTVADARQRTRNIALSPGSASELLTQDTAVTSTPARSSHL